MNEIWKDIKGYEGLYQVSNLGNVKSMDKVDYIYNYKKRQKVKRISKATLSENHLYGGFIWRSE